jgi:HEAT repeat protein
MTQVEDFLKFPILKFLHIDSILFILGVHHPKNLTVATIILFIALIELLMALSAYTVLYIIYKNLTEKRTAGLRENYRLLIIERTFEEESAQIELPRLSWLGRPLFKVELIEQISLLKGIEKRILIEFYTSMGFLAEDLAQLRSWLWWRRLKAVAILEYLQIQGAVQELRPLLRDRHPLVALASARILSQLIDSRTDHPLYREILNVTLSGLSGRRDAVIEILSNICKKNSHELVLFFSDKLEDPVAYHCANVFGNLHCIEAVDALISVTDKASEDNPLIVAEAIEALGKIGDPRALTAIKEKTTHRIGSIRARSLIALSKIDPKETELLLEKINHDPDPNVQRFLHLWIREAAG